MSKKTLITIIVTFLLTTLFWYLMARFWVLQPVVNPAEGLQLAQPAEDLNAVVEGATPAVAEEPAPVTAEATPQETTRQQSTTTSKSLKEAIVGTWKPVEASTKPSKSPASARWW